MQFHCSNVGRVARSKEDSTITISNIRMGLSQTFAASGLRVDYLIRTLNPAKITMVALESFDESFVREYRHDALYRFEKSQAP